MYTEDNNIFEASLMHKNIHVADFAIDASSGDILGKIDIINKPHLPLGISNAVSIENALARWIVYRNIPASRNGLQKVLDYFDVSTPLAASVKNLGLNLSDQYWYKPISSSINWKDVNLFDHDFDRLYASKHVTDSLNPDVSSNGNLPKFWCIKDRKRLLYKGSNGPLGQEPYNEQFASDLLERFQMPHVPYTIDVVNGHPYSVCETFVDKDTEYIPAIDVLRSSGKLNHENEYQHFFRAIEALGGNPDHSYIDNMLLFDYMTDNIDRHLGNFGVIRNADTLEIKGYAPIFDNGMSFWCNKTTREVGVGQFEGKPFAKDEKRLFNMIKSPTSLALARVNANELKSMAIHVFKQNPELSEERIRRIAEGMVMRYNYLQSVYRKRARQYNY